MRQQFLRSLEAYSPVLLTFGHEKKRFRDRSYGTITPCQGVVRNIKIRLNKACRCAGMRRCLRCAAYLPNTSSRANSRRRRSAFAPARRNRPHPRNLRRRGMHIERGFAHILDAGGMRQTTLRGWENLNKRFKLAAAFFNLSQLMRKLFGFGTPKQLAATLKGADKALFFELARCFITLAATLQAITGFSTFNQCALRQSPWPPSSLRFA